MRKTVSLAVAAFLLWSVPALAQNSCTALPAPPAATDGATATKDDIGAAAHTANVFLRAAAAYQDCLNAALDARVKEAKDAGKELAKDDYKPYVEKLAESQRLKERVGGQYHGALLNYCARKDADKGPCKT